MKKAATIFALVFMVFLVNGQSKSDKMYQKLSGEEGVADFSFAKNMIDAVNIDLGENGDEKKVTGDLYQVRFMMYNPEKGNLSGAEFCKKAVKMLPRRYKKYTENKDNDTEIRLLGKKKHFSECHLFIANQEESRMSFVVSFYGNFTVNDLDKLRETGRSFSDKK